MSEAEEPTNELIVSMLQQILRELDSMRTDLSKGLDRIGRDLER